MMMSIGIIVSAVLCIVLSVVALAGGVMLISMLRAQDGVGEARQNWMDKGKE